jgi:hypothetical protein
MILSTGELTTLGFRAHSGWTVVVAVTASPGKPMVLERHRIEIADGSIPGSKQPYHAAEGLATEKVEALIQRYRDRSARLATDAVTAFVARLTQGGRRVVGTGIIFASGRPLPALEVTLRSHALIHTAEGEFFREVLVQASEDCGLPVTRVKEREAWDRGETALRLSSENLQKLISELGRSLGPPWTQDEKLASLAGWIALAERQAHFSKITAPEPAIR